MKYREILDKRKMTMYKIENLKTHRDLKDGDISINKTINREKFKYKIYNAMLKIGGKK